MTAADAAKMFTLLEVFAPEVQIRDYKKGFIVRRGGQEWYFERREEAMQADGAVPAQAPTPQTGAAAPQPGKDVAPAPQSGKDVASPQPGKDVAPAPGVLSTQIVPP